MTSLVSLKEKLKNIYAEYGIYILPVLKFLLAFVIFREINRALPYMDALNNIFLLLVLSLICSIMPMGTTFFFGMVLIVGQCYGVGIEVAGFALVMLLLMLILYIRFAPDDVMVLLLTPLAFVLHIPCAVPLGYGLKRTPSACVSAACGVVVYYFIRQVQILADSLKGVEEKKIADNLNALFDGLLRNREMLMQIVAFVAVLILVHGIRRVSVNYARQIAIFSGAAAYLIILLAGGALKAGDMSAASLIVGTLVSLVLTEVLEFFWYHVDYSRTEYLQYEDDEYYYYVKAVPKVVGETAATQPQNHPANHRQAPQGTPVQQRMLQDTMAYPNINRGMRNVPENDGSSMSKPDDLAAEEVDFESKLEESLKEL